MKKLNNVPVLFALITFLISIPFLIMGFLGLTGNITMSENSEIQDPVVLGTIFWAVGFLNLIIATIIIFIYSVKKRKINNLLVNGTRVTGTVEKIEYKQNIRVNGKSPYVVHYSFSDNGIVYNKKSSYIYELPNLKIGEYIDVYTDGKGNSAVEL